MTPSVTTGTLELVPEHQTFLRQSPFRLASFQGAHPKLQLCLHTGLHAVALGRSLPANTLVCLPALPEGAPILLYTCTSLLTWARVRWNG